RRLDERTGEEAALLAEPLDQRADRPAVLRLRPDELRVRAVEREPELAQPLARVQVPRAAREAGAAPGDLLRADRVARAQVGHVLADGGDDAGELVPGHDRHRDHPRIEHVAIAVALVDVDVGAADAAGADADQ